MHLLLVDQAGPARDRLLDALETDGHQLSTAPTVASALARLRIEPIDLVVLDRDLPDRDGLDLVRELRAMGDLTPVIAVTAQDSVPARVRGLRDGLDDYLSHDVHPDELLARIEAVARRAGRADDLDLGALHIDTGARRVTLEGDTVELTTREFDLLVALARAAPDVRTRAELLDEVWGSQGRASSNLVDVYIRYLRTKLASELIRTVRGVGYALDPEAAADPHRVAS